VPSITLNGRSVDIPDHLENITLLDFIRDHIGLKGTKFGCGIGLCGACTVHVDGVAQRSCLTQVVDVAGQGITTIEGLAVTAPGAGLHPVQEAWLEISVPQCGYCQAGQIMSAAALLAKTPNPSTSQIKQQMNGNLCRCGTYGRIQKAITIAAGNPYYE